MKSTTQILTISLIIFLTTPIFSKVYRVNNVDLTADYQVIQLAHDNVSHGDTLYVEGSMTNYDRLECEKKLTIIGPGYLFPENNPSAHFFPASIEEIDFEPGSEGSRVIGVSFDEYTSSAPNAYADNISIERCYIRGMVEIDNVTGVRVVSNYLQGIRPRYNLTLFNDVVFNNNIVTGNMVFQTGNTSNIIKCNNNIFEGTSLEFRAGEFRNNILFATNQNDVTINSNSVQGNIARPGIQLGAGNTPISNLEALFDDDFEESDDAKYRLAPGSTALTAGYNSSECGIFGGDDPYVISGLPPLPIITVLEVDDAASVETGLRVKITVTSH